MASGIDQTLADAILDALAPSSGTATVGTKTITHPANARFMTANGSDSSAGTELATGGGYTNGTGVALAFAAAATGSKASNANASVTNMPACTLTGIEEWDSSGTPIRLLWAAFASNITINSGDTFTIASGNLTNSLS